MRLNLCRLSSFSCPRLQEHGYKANGSTGPWQSRKGPPAGEKGRWLKPASLLGQGRGGGVPGSGRREGSEAEEGMMERVRGP